MHGEIPQIFLENRDELAFAHHVFANEEDFEGDRGIGADLANTMGRIDDGEHLFPYIITGREAEIAHYIMTVFYQNDPMWGELVEEITVGMSDFQHSHAA